MAPTTARALAEVSAGLCRLSRDEVAEQLAAGTPALIGLAEDWRCLLFPEASDEEFADGYAQAVTFGLLMARAQGVADGLASADVTLADPAVGTGAYLLGVLRRPRQAALLIRICAGPIVAAESLQAVTGAVGKGSRKAAKRRNDKQGELLP